ncbi:MAG: putative glycosyltransferase EpsH [Syntrophomonadaceae bacterium]|nr:putative glycosyltransferase EpsH [Bacillota bacterium]
MNLPLVSVNIPTYNSQDTLEMCLAKVTEQTYSNIEVIVIDSYSHDLTVNIAVNYNAKVVFARGLLRQRLKGIRESNGDYILLLDSDQWLEPDVVEKCIQKCRTSEYNALILFEKSIVGNQTRTGRLAAYNMDVVQQDADVIWGTALPRFFKANILKAINPPRREVGYFDHAFLYLKAIEAGAKVSYVDALVHHYERNTFYSIITKFYRGYGMYFIPAFQEDPRLVIGKALPKRAYVSGRLLKQPDLLAGLFFLYTLKAGAAGAGVVAYLLKRIVKSPKTDGDLT